MAAIREAAESAVRCAGILKALGHPLRLRIISHLCEGDLNVSALTERLNTPQATVSQQLSILRMRGLVTVTRANGFSIYSLAEPRLVDLIRCVEGCESGRR